MIQPFRLLVSGYRNYPVARRSILVDALDNHLNAIHQVRPGAPVVLVHGAARGADSLADAWARSMPGVAPEPHLASWQLCGPECPPGPHRKPGRGGDYCPFAGPRRNAAMLQTGIDAVIAFPGPEGRVSCSRQIIQIARDAGIPCTVVEWSP
jgi:hypothetical protein